MYSIFTIVFMLAGILSRGDMRIGYFIVSALFGICDAITYTVNKKDKK